MDVDRFGNRLYSQGDAAAIRSNSSNITEQGVM
jgi:hypothetical protein